MLGKDVAVENFNNIISELGLADYTFTDTEDGEKTKERIVRALMSGHIEYVDEKFTVNLIKPFDIGRDKTVSKLVIEEPTGAQLRSMSIVKKDSDQVGKAMAILGEVTGLGIEAINKMKSRDMMISVEIIGLFL